VNSIPRVAPPLALPPAAARRFLRRVLGFDAPFADIPAALAHHGYIQIDPINVCGRMHDLILRNRVSGYREGDLMRFLHGEDAPLAPAQRRAFEHHHPATHVLVAFPLEAWPHLRRAMHQWSRERGAWAGRLTPRENELAGRLLAEIAARGPLGSEDFEDDRRARKVWGQSSLVKATLQKLFFHGRLLIAQRQHNRRRYDLPERVLPPAVLARPEAPRGDTARWIALLKLRQRRLVTLQREELSVVDDAVQRVAVAGLPPLYCLREDVAQLEAAAAIESCPPPASAESSRPRSRAAAAKSPPRPPPAAAATVHLLAPLDPLIYDRRVTAALWGFDYTWEAYTPPRKRIRGYYALPVLAGTELIGHVDPKADRAARKLVLRSRRIRRGHATAPALREFARWLGLRR
jgi:uncharacterized protein